MLFLYRKRLFTLAKLFGTKSHTVSSSPRSVSLEKQCNIFQHNLESCTGALKSAKLVRGMVKKFCPWLWRNGGITMKFIPDTDLPWGWSYAKNWDFWMSRCRTRERERALPVKICTLLPSLQRTTCRTIFTLSHQFLPLEANVPQQIFQRLSSTYWRSAYDVVKKWNPSNGNEKPSPPHHPKCKSTNNQQWQWCFKYFGTRLEYNWLTISPKAES